MKRIVVCYCTVILSHLLKDSLYIANFSTQELPILSKLDPQVYGPPESAITKDLIEPELNGMKIEEVMICWKVYLPMSVFGLQSED